MNEWMNEWMNVKKYAVTNEQYHNSVGCKDAKTIKSKLFPYTCTFNYEASILWIKAE
jgi:hypothetical protein